MTTKTGKCVVVLKQAGKCDRYLSANGTTWELDPAEADLYSRDVAKRIAAEHGDGCEAEEM